jgi:hypothetical protein
MCKIAEEEREGRRLLERFSKMASRRLSFAGTIGRRETDNVSDGYVGYCTYFSVWIGGGTQSPVNKNQREMSRVLLVMVIHKAHRIPAHLN